MFSGIQHVRGETMVVSTKMVNITLQPIFLGDKECNFLNSFLYFKQSWKHEY